MLKSIDWNIYTILMIALVPAMLLTAWGLDTWDSRRLHRLQCEVAVEWLEENAEIAPQFSQAMTMNRTALWQSNFEDINAPAAAGILRGGILGSANYTREYFPDQSTDEPGALNPHNGLLARNIEDGIVALVEHCPETEDLLPAAFPMIFHREDTN